MRPGSRKMESIESNRTFLCHFPDSPVVSTKFVVIVRARVQSYDGARARSQENASSTSTPEFKKTWV
jgi:hypothetical protein